MPRNAASGWASARGLACLAMAAAGAIHIAITVEHSEHAPAHGLFFALLGTLQLGWAAAYWLVPAKPTRTAGFVLSGGMILLWGVTRVAVAPFQSTPEPIDAAGLASFALEAAALTALLLDQEKLGRDSRASLATSAVAVSVLSSLLVYGGGLVAAPWFPGLASTVEPDFAELCSLPHAAATRAHGAARRIRLEDAEAGAYLVRAVTSQEAGDSVVLAVEIRLLDAVSGKALTDASVRLVAAHPSSGAAIEAEARQGSASVPRDYGARLELPAGGEWTVTVDIDGPAGPAETSFEVQVSSGSGIGGQLSAYLPFAGILLLVLGYFLVTRVRPRETPPTE